MAKGAQLTPPHLSPFFSWSPVYVTTSATTSNALSAQTVTRTTLNPALCPNMGARTLQQQQEQQKDEEERGRDTIAYAATASSQLDTHASLEQQWLLICVWEKGPSIWTDLVFETRTEKGT